MASLVRLLDKKFVYLTMCDGKLEQCSIHAVIHLSSVTVISEYSDNTGSVVGIHSGEAASPLQSTVHLQIHTQILSHESTYCTCIVGLGRNEKNPHRTQGERDRSRVSGGLPSAPPCCPVPCKNVQNCYI